MNGVSYTYDGKFRDNILIQGQTSCGKTTFLENLARKRNKEILGQKKNSISLLSWTTFQVFPINRMILEVF